MNPENVAPQTPSDETAESTGGATPSTTIAPTGKRQAFRDIRRQLTEADIANPGVVRLVLENLERAEAQCDILTGFVDRYHEADKRATVLAERLKTQTAIEILFGVAVGLGGAIIGVAPIFWDATAKGPIALIIGVVLIVGGTAARIVKR